jgi:hypothetical protein
MAESYDTWDVMSAADSFATIADCLLREQGVDEGTGFGSNPGLRVGSKIFAMLVRDELVLKLPADRCEVLVLADAAVPFERGQGRPLREWVVVGADVEGDWLALARESLEFVRGASPPRRGREGRRR